ncbi:MAG: ChaN family lipoprotein [Kiloniellaceae bacterium]
MFLAATMLDACAGGGGTSTPDPPAPPWVAEVGRDHPLAGRIWRPAQARFVEPGALVEALAGARYVLLGEKHDNADHHRLQAWLLARLIARGRAPAVAFEMFASDQQPALEAYLAAHPGDAAGLGAAVGWDKTGWPDWARYRPIAQAALDADAPILAANLSRATIQSVAKEGVAALGAARVRALGLERAMPAALAARMHAQIVASHCDQLPESMIGPMTTVMRARDAHMAGVLIRGARMAGRDGAVLITGKGHARTDYGVPFHLRRLAPGEAAASLALVEVAEDEADPAAYAARFGAQALPFDFVWFTARAQRKEPCEEFAEQLRRAKERHLREREAE